jgi:hypothetical protein
LTSQHEGEAKTATSGQFVRAQGWALRSFSEFDSSVEAIRDLAVNARAHTKPLDDGKAYFLKLVRRWNSHDSDEDILAVMNQTAQLTNDALKLIQERIESGEDFNPGSEITEAVRSARHQAIKAHCSDASEQFNYGLTIQRVLDRRSRNTVLHSSLLVSAVGSFEVLVGNIARAYFTAFPEALRSSETSISTDFLAQFETMDEFWAIYRESRVEKLMREDVAAWLNWCEKHLRMKPEQTSPDHRGLIEVFLTRNVHVHNAGKVNDVYLKTCRRHELTPRQERPGIKLPVTPSYLVKSIDTLHVTGMLVVYGLLKKLASKIDEEEFAGPWLNSNIYVLLEEEQYDAMLSLAQLLPDFDGHFANTTRVNIWVARKKKGGLDAIRAEVEAWNTDDLEARYKLVRFALLDDYPAAEKVADEIFGSEQLSRPDWNRWPVLKGLRDWVSEDPDRGRFLLREQQSGPGGDSEPSGTGTTD